MTRSGRVGATLVKDIVGQPRRPGRNRRAVLGAGPTELGDHFLIGVLRLSQPLRTVVERTMLPGVAGKPFSMLGRGVPCAPIATSSCDPDAPPARAPTLLHDHANRIMNFPSGSRCEALDLLCSWAVFIEPNL